jgi:predicted O-linked N-acetylglucosamine transferase (SPINDLY family)
MGKAERRQKRLAAGWQAIERNDPSAAEEIAGAELKKHSRDTDFLNLLGTCFLLQNRFAEAAVPLLEVFRKTGTRGAGYQLGHCYFMAGDPGRAAAVLEKEVRAFPGFIEAQNLLGIVLTQLSRHAEALSVFESVLKAWPHVPGVYANAGNILLHLGRADEAIPHFKKAIELQPDFPQAYNGLGAVYRALKQDALAIDHYKRASQLAPEDVETHLNLGDALADMDLHGEAIASYEAALAASPDHAAGHNSLGVALGESGRYDEAIECFNRALALKPDYADAHTNLGLVYHKQNRPAEAEGCHRTAISLNPHHAQAHANLGSIRLDEKRLDEAAACYQRALSVKPDFAMAHTLLGTVYQKQERLEEAIACHQRALSIDPDLPEACTNLGAAYHRKGRLNDAIALFEKAIALAPDLADAHHNLGVIFQQLGRPHEAVSCFRKALAAEPERAYTLSALVWNELAICSWEELGNRVTTLRARTRNRQSIAQPLVLLAVSDDPEEQRAAAEMYIRDRLASLPPTSRPEARYTREKIRLAYLSADFREHPVANCISELMELHDRSRFKVIGVSLGADDGSAQRSRLVSAFDRFADLRTQSDSDAAGALRDMEIDIAVDLMGHTQDSRPGILARRPAPIQVNYLGYPGTMAADFIDYIVADRFVIPEAHRKYYAESVVYLPDSYLPADVKRKLAQEISGRIAAGLPEDGIVFCCFNNSHKITPQIFDIWMRLLKRLPRSALWLRRENVHAEANLRKEAQARGVEPGRLIFAPRVALDQHLARHRLADLFLDTSPYNAHTTASDALWAGLPVLTCAGGAFAGRVAGSLLHTLRLPELVAENLEAYEALALQLASEPRLLAGIREKLEQNRLSAPLFDTNRLRRHIESAYVRMWEMRQRGEKPRSFAVEPLE